MSKSNYLCSCLVKLFSLFGVLYLWVIILQYKEACLRYRLKVLFVVIRQFLLTQNWLYDMEYAIDCADKEICFVGCSLISSFRLLLLQEVDCILKWYFMLESKVDLPLSFGLVVETDALSCSSSRYKAHLTWTYICIFCRFFWWPRGIAWCCWCFRSSSSRLALG